MTARIVELVGDRCSIQKFADLPKPYQLAIIWYMAVDGDAWDEVDRSSWDEAGVGSMSHLEREEYLKRSLIELLPSYVNVYGNTLFGSVLLDAETLKNSVMNDEEISDSYSSWDDYHNWYLSGGVPTYPDNERWPVILSSDDFETILDGWHRFHSYARDGAVEVGAVFFPS